MLGMTTRLVVFALAALLTNAGASLAAGDRWQAGFSMFEYVEDVGDVAVFSWSRRNGDDIRPVGFLYFPGLANGQLGNGSGEGYYLLTGEGRCENSKQGPNGFASSNWGTAIIVFHDPPPPTAWTILMGQCSGPVRAEFSFRAIPVD